MNNYCMVKNRGAGHVTYRIPELNIRRSFAPGEVKKITFEELEKLTYRPGGMYIITNFLQIQDNQILNDVVGKVEPEYHMSENDIVKLIKEGSLDSFLDALDFAPVGVIDLIKDYSIKVPLTDINKKKALKAKTGFDVESVIKHIEEEKEDNIQNTILKQSGERRVKPENVPAGRRTELPKYNIVTKAE